MIDNESGEHTRDPGAGNTRPRRKAGRPPGAHTRTLRRGRAVREAHELGYPDTVMVENLLSHDASGALVNPDDVRRTLRRQLRAADRADDVPLERRDIGAAAKVSHALKAFRAHATGHDKRYRHVEVPGGWTTADAAFHESRAKRLELLTSLRNAMAEASSLSAATLRSHASSGEEDPLELLRRRRGAR